MRISDAITSKTTLPTEIADIFVLVVLVSLIALLFKLVRDGFLALFKIEPTSIIDKWCAFAFGIFRAALLISLILIVMFFTSVDYMKNSIKSSYSGSKLVQFAPRVYAFCFEKVVAKFFPEEELNNYLFEELNQ